MEKVDNIKGITCDNKEDIYQKLIQLDKNEIFELTLKKIGGFGSFQKILWCIGLLSCFLGSSDQTINDKIFIS
jgi:hypothetical protein